MRWLELLAGLETGPWANVEPTLSVSIAVRVSILRPIFIDVPRILSECVAELSALR